MLQVLSKYRRSINEVRKLEVTLVIGAMADPDADPDRDANSGKAMAEKNFAHVIEKSKGKLEFKIVNGYFHDTVRFLSF